jgi:hypothetical protein
VRSVRYLHGAAVAQRAALAADAGLNRSSDRLFSGPSASLQRGLNRGGDTYSDGMTNKGGFCGLSATKRDAHRHWRDVGPFGRIDQEQEPVMVFEGTPSPAGSHPSSHGGCATIETTSER